MQFLTGSVEERSWISSCNSRVGQLGSDVAMHLVEQEMWVEHGLWEFQVKGELKKTA